jgi:hypothetical protein
MPRCAYLLALVFLEPPSIVGFLLLGDIVVEFDGWPSVGVIIVIIISA